DEMEGEENQLLKSREEKSNQSEKNIFFILPIGIFISFVILGSVLFLLNKGVAKRKQSEEALQESEEKFRAIYEGSNDAVMLLNEKGFFDCNPRTLEMFGFQSKEEFTRIGPA